MNELDKWTKADWAELWDKVAEGVRHIQDWSYKHDENDLTVSKAEAKLTWTIASLLKLHNGESLEVLFKRWANEKRGVYYLPTRK